MLKKYVLLLLIILFPLSTTFAQNKPEPDEKDKAKDAKTADLGDNFSWDEPAIIQFGLFKTTGSLYPKLSYPFEIKERSVNAYTVLARTRGKIWYAQGDIDFVKDENNARGYSINVQQQIFRIGPVRPGIAFRVAYATQKRTLIDNEYVNLSTGQRNVWLVGGPNMGIGKLNKNSFRAGWLFGSILTETTLDLYLNSICVTGEDNNSHVEAPNLRGYHVEGSLRWKGLFLTGEFIRYYDFPNYGGNILPKSADILTGSLSYASPWHIGVFIKGKRVSHIGSISFLNDKTTFGITLSK